jgi:hypothetical protein
MSLTETVAVITLVTLGDNTQIELSLFVWNQPRLPRQVQQLLFSIDLSLTLAKRFLSTFAINSANVDINVIFK